MRLLNLFCLILMPLFLLSACKDRKGNELYNYLMLHPYSLKSEIANCQVVDPETKELSPRCQIVTKAAGDMMAMIEDQQKNPEKFGQTIITTQMNRNKLKDSVDNQLAEIEKLRNQAGKEKKLAAAEIKFTNTLRKYQEVNDRVKILLGIVGLSSPE